MLHDVELLAPAGNAAALHAAVRGGADAVYLGLDSFNARRGADNFTMETFAEACDYAHLRGVSVYVTFNTAVLPSELTRALERFDRHTALGPTRSSCRISAWRLRCPAHCRRRACIFPRR